MSRPKLSTVALTAAGFALGAAAEHQLIHKRFLYQLSNEDFGSLRGEPVSVTSDDGVQLHVEVDPADENLPENSDGLTVLFCHGYCLNQDTWHYQRKALRGRARLIFADQRSHGRSGRGDPALSDPDQLGRDVGRIIDELAPSSPLILVGHSMGGMTLMGLAANRPELFESGQVKGVVFMGTSAGGLDDWAFGLPMVVGNAMHRTTPVVMDAVVKQARMTEWMRHHDSDLAMMLSKRYSFGSDVDPAVVDFAADMIRDTPIDVVAEFLPGLEKHEKVQALDVISQAKIPVTVLVGNKDLMTPVAHNEFIVSRIPNVHFTVYPDTGHMLMLERPDEVTAEISDMIDRVRGRSA